jgi:hypothetical protein
MGHQTSTTPSASFWSPAKCLAVRAVTRSCEKCFSFPHSAIQHPTFILGCTFCVADNLHFAGRRSAAWSSFWVVNPNLAHQWHAERICNGNRVVLSALPTVSPTFLSGPLRATDAASGRTRARTRMMGMTVMIMISSTLTTGEVATRLPTRSPDVAAHLQDDHAQDAIPQSDRARRTPTPSDAGR